jgi:hypothetical protein
MSRCLSAGLTVDGDGSFTVQRKALTWGVTF